MKHDLTASSYYPGATLLSRELLESNTPSENPKYKTDVKELKDKANRKEVVTAVNDFVQVKLNTLTNSNTLSSFNDTVKSKKLLNKLVTDEHYLAMNGNNLQVVDSKKDTQGKPIDLDKRSHRKLVGKYLSYLAKDTKALNTGQKQAASDLVSYIEELNALADQHSLDIGNFIQTIKGKFFKQAIKDGKSLAKALNKDLNLDSTKYSYLEAGAFDGLKISEKEVQANEKIAVVKDKLQNTLKQVVLPSGVSSVISEIKPILTSSTETGSYTAEVDLKKDEATSLGKLTLTVDSQGNIAAIKDGGTITDYRVTLTNGKLTVKTEAQAQEDKKSDEVKGKIVSNITLPDDNTLTSIVTPIKNTINGSYDTATVDFIPKDSTTSLGTLTLTVDGSGTIKNQAGTITGYDVTLANGKLTVSKKADEVKEEETENEKATLFTGLTPPAGKKVLDLNNNTIKPKLEEVFTAIGGVSGYESIIVNNNDDDGGTMNLDATIKAFQTQYMTLNKNKSHIGGKNGKPDGKIGPKTLAAMKEVLGVDDTPDQGGNSGNIDGADNDNNKEPSKNNSGGTKKPSDDSEKTKEELKEKYASFFAPYENKTGFSVEIEEVQNDSFLFYLRTNTNSPNSFITIEFEVTRREDGSIEGIRAKGHNNNDREFNQSGAGNITVAPRGNGNNMATYKIKKGGKEFLVGFDVAKKKRLYNVVDIDEKLKNEYLGLFYEGAYGQGVKKNIISNDNNNFSLELKKNGKSAIINFIVTRSTEGNITTMKINTNTNNRSENSYLINKRDGKTTFSAFYNQNQNKRFYDVRDINK